MKVKVVTKKYRLSAQTGQDRINVSTRSGIVMARKLSDLQDVDVSGVKDQFVLMYDQNENKYKAVNPDEVLISSALTETTQPGLPQQFIEYLNTILNLDDQDPAIPLNVPRKPHTLSRRDAVAISNSFGFGGHNAVLAFRNV